MTVLFFFLCTIKSSLGLDSYDRLYPQRPSGHAAVIGVYHSPPPVRAFIFIAYRFQRCHCFFCQHVWLVDFHRVCEQRMLSRVPLANLHARKSPFECDTSIHSGGLNPQNRPLGRGAWFTCKQQSPSSVIYWICYTAVYSKMDNVISVISNTPATS